MRTFVISLLALTVTPVATAAAAPSGAEVGQCMIENSSTEAENALREMMIAALEDRLVEAQEGVMEMGMAIVSIAMNSCGIQIADLQTPLFEEASSIYGQWVGEKIVSEAFAKIGL